MKKWVTSLITAFLMLNLGLTIHQAFADLTVDPKSQKNTMSDLQSIGEGTGLPSLNFNQHPSSPVDAEYAGLGNIGSIAYFLYDLVKYLMSTIAVVMIVVYSIKFITAGSNEETTKNIKKGLGVSVAGLIVIQLADFAVKKVFFGEFGEVLEDSSTEQFAKAGAEQLSGIVGFIQIALGGIAVLVIIINGLKIMITGMEEENRKKALKNIGYAAAGLIIVGLSEFLVKGVVFRELGAEMPSTDAAKVVIQMITNFISGFVAVLSFVMLLYAGYTYVVAGSDETARGKVKKLLTGAIIGILVALGAYALTNTLIKFQEPTEYKAVDQQINTDIQNE